MSVNAKSMKSAALLDEQMDWQERNGGEVVSDAVAVLWNGEVLITRAPGGMAGPFYATENEAREWAYQTALAQPRDEVLSLQVVSWRCAGSFVTELLEKNTMVFDRLKRFWASPIRLRSVLAVPFPI